MNLKLENSNFIESLFIGSDIYEERCYYDNWWRKMSSAALRGNKQEAVYCATKWGERGYTKSLKTAYKGTSVKVIGVYPGGMNTNFYQNSRDYVSIEKSNSFMNPEDVAKVIIDNVTNDTNLTVADIIIERN